jgi:hypothetical protein
MNSSIIESNELRKVREYRREGLYHLIPDEYRTAQDYIELLDQGLDIDTSIIPFTKFNRELYYKLYEKNPHNSQKYPHVLSKSNFVIGKVHKDIDFILTLPNEMFTQEMLEDYLMILTPNVVNSKAKIVKLLKTKNFKWSEEFAIQYLQRITSVPQARILPEDILTPKVIKAAYDNEILRRRLFSSRSNASNMKNTIIEKMLTMKSELENLSNEYMMPLNTTSQEIEITSERISTCQNEQWLVSIILDFVDSDCQEITEYCLKKGLDRNKVVESIKALETTNPDMYNFYNASASKNINEGYDYIVVVANTIRNYLENGIDTPNGKREMTIIDYYKLSLCPFSEILSILYRRVDKILLEKIFDYKRNYEESTQPNKRKAFENQILNISFRNPDILETEKLRILEYLNRNNVPLSLKIFTDTYALYKAKEINLEETLCPKITYNVTPEKKSSIKNYTTAIEYLQRIDQTLDGLEKRLQELFSQKDNLLVEYQKKKERIIDGRK